VEVGLLELMALLEVGVGLLLLLMMTMLALLV
jgi:hypothetical protein